MTHSNQQSNYFDMSNSKEIKRPIEGIEKPNRTSEKSITSMSLHGNKSFTLDPCPTCGSQTRGKDKNGVFIAYCSNKHCADSMPTDSSNSQNLQHALYMRFATFMTLEQVSLVADFIQANYLSKKEVEAAIEEAFTPNAFVACDDLHPDAYKVQHRVKSMVEGALRQTLGLDTKKEEKS